MNANPMLGRLLAKYSHVLKDILAVHSGDDYIEIQLREDKFHEFFNEYSDEYFNGYYNHRLVFSDGKVKFFTLEHRQ